MMGLGVLFGYLGTVLSVVQCISLKLYVLSVDYTVNRNDAKIIDEFCILFDIHSDFKELSICYVTFKL